jgi:hypothetical protein
MQDRSLPSSMWVLQPERTGNGTHFDVAVSGRVNVRLTFRDPLPLRTRKGAMVVTGVSLWADAPREAADNIRREAESKLRRG